PGPGGHWHRARACGAASLRARCRARPGTAADDPHVPDTHPLPAGACSRGRPAVGRGESLRLAGGPAPRCAPRRPPRALLERWIGARCRDCRLLRGAVDFPAAVASLRGFRVSAIASVSDSPMSALLSLADVGKDYAKADARGGRLRLVADLLRGRPAAHVFCALDGITLEMSRGESLGVIGENGAGKSTLLKIIAGVIKPTRGTVAINGRFGALLELG